jgi:hypothetical protein
MHNLSHVPESDAAFVSTVWGVLVLRTLLHAELDRQVSPLYYGPFVFQDCTERDRIHAA